MELSIGFTKIFSKVAKKPSANEAKGLNFAILNTRSIKYFPILPHRKVVHLLHGIGAIVIEPSGDDGAESVDEEGGFVVAGRVIGCRLEVCAKLLGIGFDGIKKPREVLGGVLAALAYPMYNLIVKRERKKIAPEIIRLTDELMK